jgi:hypothetical protein
MKTPAAYAVVLGKSLMPHPYDTPEAAQKAANGMMLSRSAERRVAVVPVIPGHLGGIGEPVLIGRRSKRGAPVRWSAAEETQSCD